MGTLPHRATRGGLSFCQRVPASRTCCDIPRAAFLQTHGAPSARGARCCTAGRAVWSNTDMQRSAAASLPAPARGWPQAKPRIASQKCSYFPVEKPHPSHDSGVWHRELTCWLKRRELPVETFFFPPACYLNSCKSAPQHCL